MGHLLEILIVAGIALAIFGPKALQDIARNTGKGVGQANAMKDKFMADMPIKELNSVAETVSKVPTNPAQAVQMMVKKSLLPDEKPAEKAPEQPAGKVVESPAVQTKNEA
ncbi:MAG TPA: twin-arginine translocase TatA/TatE family subunit [Ktedonobacteraceae bacterium]|jgi:Sec-independent protein translocase protein TatA